MTRNSIGIADEIFGNDAIENHPGHPFGCEKYNKCSAPFLKVHNKQSSAPTHIKLVHPRTKKQYKENLVLVGQRP